LATLATLIGALVITFLVSRLIGRVLKGRVPDPSRLLIANGGTLAVATFLGGYGFAPSGTPPVFTVAFTTYVLPVLAWTAYDIVRWKMRKETGQPSG
jgi:hypothetical protein